MSIDRGNWTTDFELTLEVVPITLRRAKDEGSVAWECELRELNGFQRDLYLNSEKTKIDSTRQNVKDFKDVQATLISKCLYDQATNEPVPLKDIRDFPSKVQNTLYKMCIELNGFDAASEEAAKNS